MSLFRASSSQSRVGNLPSGKSAVVAALLCLPLLGLSGCAEPTPPGATPAASAIGSATKTDRSTTEDAAATDASETSESAAE